VTVSLPQYAAANARVDDLCTQSRSALVAAAKSELLEAAAGDGRTVNRDWSNKHRGRFSPSKTLVVLVVL